MSCHSYLSRWFPSSPTTGSAEAASRVQPSLNTTRSAGEPSSVMVGSEVTATRRCGPLRGLRPRLRPFFALRAKKRAFYIFFGPNFGNFWWSVVTSVTFSSNLSNLKKIQKNSKISKNPKKVRKIQKKYKKITNNLVVCPTPPLPSCLSSKNY